MRTLLLACLIACSSSPAPAPTAPAPTTPAPAPSPAPPAADPQPADPSCGMKPTDWCPAPAGDPCGAHKDKATCQADLKCYGMRYRGESLVACQYDARGFATNCPTVGCQSPTR